MISQKRLKISCKMLFNSDFRHYLVTIKSNLIISVFIIFFIIITIIIFNNNNLILSFFSLNYKLTEGLYFNANFKMIDQKCS